MVINMIDWLKKLFKKEDFDKEKYMKEMAAVVNRYVDFFDTAYGASESAITHWGSWVKLAEGDKFKVKIILVDKGHKFSLQYHDSRDELWLVVSGNGAATIGDGVNDCKPGDYYFIPKGTKHRMECIGSTDLRFIEIQWGDCEEDDITRLEDDYGRA